MADTVECPYCGEDIKAGAIKYKHCHSFVGGEGEYSAQEQQIEKNHSDKVREAISETAPNPFISTSIPTTDFEIYDHSLVLYGKCKECKRSV